MRDKKGFTLAELMVVVAIIGVLVAVSVPIFNSQLEKSREATDLANVRSAYAQVMTEAINKETAVPVQVVLKQKQSGWQSKLPITLGGVTFNGEETTNWVGTPKAGGVCTVSYVKSQGAIFNWEGGAALPENYVNFTAVKAYLENEAHGPEHSSMQGNGAFYSFQNLYINGNIKKIRAYYADSPAFKKNLESYTPKPSKYSESPFYSAEGEDHKGDYGNGFAYYTYDENKKVKEFTYVNETNVYQTKDGGKTWYDITPKKITP